MSSVYEEKLSESGLTVKDAELLKIFPLSALESRALSSHNKNKPALKFNYYGPDGSILSDTPGCDPYWRVRYLDEKPEGPEGFEKQTKPQRYSNLPGTTPVAYWPQNYTWAPVLNDVTKPVIFVEGELKAAKGCKEGFATIGLSGVDCWRARRRGINFLDSFKPLTFLRRDVYICFDSDYLTKKSILRALVQFSEHLVTLGSFVQVITLPSIPDLAKTGLDDFLVYLDKDAEKDFRALLSKAQPLGLVRPLFELNKKYVVLSTPPCIYEKSTETKHKVEPFKNLIESHNKITLRVPETAEKGSEVAKYKYKELSAPTEWLSWPLGDRCDSLVYAPGNGEYVAKDIRGKKYVDYNCWSGWGAKPVEGDVSLFLALIDFLFKDAEPKDKDWFLRWLAYPIQNPGAKLYTACVIHGTTQGTGKTLVGYTVGGIYGTNYKEVDQGSLEGDFHKPFINRQFILGDEITGNDQRKFSDRLKRYITGHEILINDKYVPQYYIRNCINFYFTSNHPDAFYLEDSDRRFFIHKTPDETLGLAFYKKYDQWYRTQDNPPRPRSEAVNALMYYFLNLDTTTFDPRAPAPSTQSKEHMLELSQSDLGSWARQAKDHPDETIGRTGRDIFSSAELLLHYDPMGKTRVTANGIARELTRANVPRGNDGKKLRTQDKICRYYILRNKEKWLKADLQALKDHIAKNAAFMTTTEQTKY